MYNRQRDLFSMLLHIMQVPHDFRRFSVIQASHTSHTGAMLRQIVSQGLKLQLLPHQKTVVLELMMDTPMLIVVVIVLFHSV